MNNSDIFCRSGLLLGQDVMSLLHEARVIIFGVGGVGSWCAESLVRTGLCHLTIVDGDHVCASNINRQLMATTKTVGEVKVDAMKRHLLEVNPEAEIIALHRLYNEDTHGEFALSEYDVVIDCIDSLKDKELLIRNATDKGVKLFSSMGAALKIDPTKIRVAEFRQVKGCPLARALRQRFKKSGTWPRRKFQCVYSEELLRNKQYGDCEDNKSKGEAQGKMPNGSLMHITAIFGLTLAGLALNYLANSRR